MLEMTLLDRLAEGGLGTLIGIVTVFIVLILLWGILELFRVIFYHPERDQKPAENSETVQVPAAQEDDTQLIAVITAAVAASMGTQPSQFKIKSFKRTGSNFRRE